MNKKIKSRVGEVYTTYQGYKVEIIEYKSYAKCTVLFNDVNNTIRTNVQVSKLKSGSLKNPNHPSIYGVGYGVYKNNHSLPSYKKWQALLERSFCEKYKSNRPSYKDVTTCEEWYNFQNFTKWYEDNWKPWMNSTWHLDKDILIKGNKIYSPETCCFVPSDLNSLLTRRQNKRGIYPIGVSKRKNKYLSRINIKGVVKNLGLYKTPEGAFQVYKEVKETCIKEAADKWKDLIDSRVYEALYNYKVEITD